MVKLGWELAVGMFHPMTFSTVKSSLSSAAELTIQAMLATIHNLLKPDLIFILILSPTANILKFSSIQPSQKDIQNIVTHRPVTASLDLFSPTSRMHHTSALPVQATTQARSAVI